MIKGIKLCVNSQTPLLRFKTSYVALLDNNAGWGNINDFSSIASIDELGHGCEFLLGRSRTRCSP